MSIPIAAICIAVIAGTAWLSRRLARVCAGSLLSVCMALFLQETLSLRDTARLLAAQSDLYSPVLSLRNFNRAVRSLAIAARFNRLIILFYHSYRNPEPRFS